MRLEEKKKPQRWPGRAAAGAAVLVLLLTCLLPGRIMAWAAPDMPAAVAAAAVSVPGEKVIPLGRAVGIKLFSDGVLVVGLSSIDTAEGPASPGRTSGLKAGDVITRIDQTEVNTIEEVQNLVAQKQDAPMTLQVRRDGSDLQLTARAVRSQAGNYQLGVWLRDSMAGIGTMTFYDPQSGVFAALGHGINDVDTAKLMPLEKGSIMEASVSDVKQGKSGEPGELHGAFNLTEDLGQLYANTDRGIFGRLDGEQLTQGLEPVEVAARDQVHEGKAVIRSNISGEQVEEYSIEITRLYPETEGETRNMMIRVTDPRLLEATGGIVQGMSGSPIIQDGRLVGAVTHVLVNDSARGYGILAENMLRAAQSAQISAA
ncbi:MAG: SpoIVB peptidase [Oscillospiraceae bacterium]|nr:SpoIVB peptidase [Oscillospiraceae bacterium]